MTENEFFRKDPGEALVPFSLALRQSQSTNWPGATQLVHANARLHTLSKATQSQHKKLSLKCDVKSVFLLSVWL